MNYNKYLTHLDGVLYWNKSRGRVSEGSVAGRLNHTGYRRVCIEGIDHYCHRVIWIMEKGPIPTGMEIDHVNGNRDDNRIDNLRLATPSQNKANKPVRKDSGSGIKGVHWYRARNVWQVKIQVQGVNRHIGHFKDLLEAKQAYEKAALFYFGEFANRQSITHSVEQ